MNNRLDRIVTRTGDDGSTGLADGRRVAKHAPRVEALGSVDELNSTVGLLAAESLPGPVSAGGASSSTRAGTASRDRCIERSCSSLWYEVSIVAASTRRTTITVAGEGFFEGNHSGCKAPAASAGTAGKPSATSAARPRSACWVANPTASASL